jgi:hypothetical protein
VRLALRAAVCLAQPMSPPTPSGGADTVVAGVLIA